MALLARPRDRARHAARTPLLQQLGFRRRPAALQESLRFHRPALSAPTVQSGPEHARTVVARLTGGRGLVALDWRYQDGAATAQVDPGLVPAAARDVLTSYATALGAVTLAENTAGRLLLRASRSVDGVVVTVWADVTPIPLGPELPAVPESPQPVEQLPIERLAHCALDDTQVFDAITDDTPAPGSSDNEPAGDVPNTDDVTPKEDDAPHSEEATEPESDAHKDAA